MKIKFTRKRLATVILLIIILPILYHKTSGFIGGMIMGHMMSLPKEVVIGNPTKETVNITVEASGRVEAEYSVDIVARVAGFLQKKYFKEGDFVKKNQLLFQIDPREYQLEVNNARAAVNQYAALLKNSQQELDRANALIKEDLISHSLVDQNVAQRNQNSALLDSARQRLELAKVNLGYTSIRSPIDGRIGKENITEGNYVALNSGSLINISSVNPVYVTFSLKGTDFLKLLKASDKFKDVKVQVQFSDGEWYDQEGTINFVDNQVDINSGSVKMRATFKNPDLALMPGDYLNVKLVASRKVDFITVPQASTKGDAMSGYYVWAVVPDNSAEKNTLLSKIFKSNKSAQKYKVVRKDIKVSDDINNNWIVLSGIDYGDEIVLSGVQRITADGQKVIAISKEDYEKKQNSGK